MQTTWANHTAITTDTEGQDFYQQVLEFDADNIDRAMERGVEQFVTPATHDGPIVTQSVKYGRDRDFLTKYGWVRMIDPQTSKVVYRQREGRWPEQPSVKTARRAMKAFFDQRRRNWARRRDREEGFNTAAENNIDLRRTLPRYPIATAHVMVPALPFGPPHPCGHALPIVAAQVADGTPIYDTQHQLQASYSFSHPSAQIMSAQSWMPASAAPSATSMPATTQAAVLPVSADGPCGMDEVGCESAEGGSVCASSNDTTLLTPKSPSEPESDKTCEMAAVAMPEAMKQLHAYNDRLQEVRCASPFLVLTSCPLRMHYPPVAQNTCPTASPTPSL